MKQISDKTSLAIQLLLAMVFCYLLFTILASILSPAINAHAGLTFEASVLNEATPNQRQWLRLSLMINNLFSYAGTAILAFWLVFRKDWPAAAGFHKLRSPKSALFSLVLFFAAVPLVIYIAWVNLQVPLPDWAVQDEAFTNLLIGTILKIENPGEFLLALTTMAITPAIGEELLYRGVIQRGILGAFFKNRHLTIWIAAAIFSGAHFEFAGFLPRLVLGAALGYAYYWSKSIWMPIFLHFLFNGTQVVSTYLTGEYRPDTEMEFVPGLWIGAIGLIGTATMLWYGEQVMNKAEETTSGDTLMATSDQ